MDITIIMIWVLTIYNKKSLDMVIMTIIIMRVWVWEKRNNHRIVD